MELHLKIIGCLLILLSFIHVFFPRYFKWTQQLESLSLINRQMMQTHTFFIALTVLLMGVLCITSAKELVTTQFGKHICFGLGIFWFARMCFQFFGYSSRLWRGKRFETAMHILFSVFWIYLNLVFFGIFFS